MISIRKKAPIHLIVRQPQTDKAAEALARRIADIHADAVIRRLEALNCPLSQKQALRDGIILTVKRKKREQED